MVAPGHLYYVPAWNHFAFKFGTTVLHANIGVIISSQYGGTPRRVRECNQSMCRGETACNYYHDPVTNRGSQDVRNYMADSRSYVPVVGGNPDTPTRGRRHYGARRYGSLDYLMVDLQSMDSRDARKYMDEVAHDLLCALVMAKYGGFKNI